MIGVRSKRNPYLITSTLSKNDQRRLRHQPGAIKEQGISCDNINCLKKLEAEAYAAAREAGREDVTTTPILAPEAGSGDVSTTPTFDPEAGSGDVATTPTLDSEPGYEEVTTNSTLVPESTLISCDTEFEETESPIILQYKFAMEYDENYNEANIIATLEAGMNEYIASSLMSCETNDNSRQLKESFLQRREFKKEDVGIIALDSEPKDKISMSAACATSESNNNCHVVEGSLQIFLRPDASPEIATLKVQLSIKKYLNSLLVIDGLFTTLYLSPDIINPNEIANGNIGGSGGFAVQNGLSSRSVTLFALAGVALMFSVVLAYSFRSSRMAHSSYVPPSPDTNELKTSSVRIDSMATRSSEEDADEGLSPFSRMLPAAYRLDDGQDEMSVILELDESNSSAKSASLIMSDGYSDDETTDDIDLSALNFSRISQAPVLGAKRRRGGISD